MSVKQEIRNCYMDMIKSGNDKITVNSLCEKLNISRKTFYKYFKDKYDIIEDIVRTDYSFHQSIAYLENNHKDESVIILNSLYSKIYENKDFYYNLLKYDKEYRYMLDCLYKENRKMNEAVFVQQGFKYKNETEKEYHIHIAALSGMNLVDKWIQDKFKISSRETSEIFFKFIVSSWY